MVRCARRSFQNLSVSNPPDFNRRHRNPREGTAAPTKAPANSTRGSRRRVACSCVRNWLTPVAVEIPQLTMGGRVLTKHLFDGLVDQVNGLLLLLWVEIGIGYPTPLQLLRMRVCDIDYQRSFLDVHS